MVSVVCRCCASKCQQTARQQQLREELLGQRRGGQELKQNTVNSMGAAASHIDGTGNQLIKAVKAGQVDLVTELISAHPALLRYQTLRHLNACHFAARADHVGVLQHLFSKAEEIEFMERLHGASKEHLDIVGQLANSRSDRGITPLMLAVERGCAESVKLLLEKVGTSMSLAPAQGPHTESVNCASVANRC